LTRPPVVEIVRRRTPPTNDLRAGLFAHLIRLDRISRGLVLSVALRSERPAVRDHRFVRRAVMRSNSNHQPRIKPAAKLVAAFDVNVRGPTQFWPAFQHGDGRRATVEPNVENVSLFGPLLRVTCFARVTFR